jgi:CheY-like chemotaxis protein
MLNFSTWEQSFCVRSHRSPGAGGLADRGGAFGLRPLQFPWPRWGAYFSAAFPLRSLRVARDLEWCEHDYGSPGGSGTTIRHPLLGEGLATLLEWQTGLSSVQAGSLAEAKGLLEEAKHKPACIIVDLDLADGEGNELLKELDGIPVLALIKGHSLLRRAEAMELGADEVLRTGSVEKLAAAVERLIGH